MELTHIMYRDLLISNKNAIFIILTIVLTLVLYRSVFSAYFVWDDMIFFFEQDSFTQGKWSWEVVSQTVLPHASYFRPLVFTTYIYEIKLFGLNPFVFHAVNLIIHLANIVLAYFLARLLLNRFNISHANNRALLVALIYAIHPTQVEAVAWIAGRFDLLAAFFSFITLILLLRNDKSKAVSILGGFSWLMALFSKDSAVLILPILFFFYTALESNRNWFKAGYNVVKQYWFTLIVMLGVFFIYFYLRTQALSETLKFNEQLFYILDGSIIKRIILPFYLIAEYTIHTIWPFFNIGPIHPLTEEIFYKLQWYLYPILSLFLLTALLYGLVKKNRIAIFFGSFLLALALVIQIIPIYAGGTIQDRFLYFPLFFILLVLVSFSFPKLTRRSENLLYCVGVIWVLLLTWTTYMVSPMWKNNLTLWGWQYLKYPDSYAREYYFKELLVINRLDLLQKEFDTIINSKDFDKKGFSPSTQLIYAAYLVRKNDPESINYLEGLLSAYALDKEGLPVTHDIQMRRSYIEASVQLAQAYIFINKDYLGAREIYEKVKKIDPSHPNVINLNKILELNFQKRH